jgi:archaellum biogenesis protein FlaJ (TadC family)
VVQGVYTQGVEEAQTKALEVFSFSFEGVQLLETLALPCILVMSVTTAVAVMAADGGSGYKLSGYLAVTLGLSGIGLVVVPMLVGGIFSSLPAM